MDIENLPKENKKVETTGLLAKRKTEDFGGIDMDNPAVRVGMQMRVLRKHREEIKNGA